MIIKLIITCPDEQADDVLQSIRAVADVLDADDLETDIKVEPNQTP